MPVTNYLSPTAFDVSISRLPNVEFFVQAVVIPDVSSVAVSTDNPVKPFYDVPDRLAYGDLSMTLIADENLENYYEILTWMEGIGSPQSSEQYKRLAASPNGLRADISVIILNSAKNPNKKFTFNNCFPTTLGSLELSNTTSDVEYSTYTADFRYDGFVLENIE